MNSTYFITTSTAQRRPILQSDRMAQLLLEVLMDCRNRGIAIHEFVIMPEHLHVLLTTQNLTIERTVQLIKGGFSFRAKRERDFNGEVWQAGYHDRRVHGLDEFYAFALYIRENPVKRGLCLAPQDYR